MGRPATCTCTRTELEPSTHCRSIGVRSEPCSAPADRLQRLQTLRRSTSTVSFASSAGKPASLHRMGTSKVTQHCWSVPSAQALPVWRLLLPSSLQAADARGGVSAQPCLPLCAAGGSRRAGNRSAAQDCLSLGPWCRKRAHLALALLRRPVQTHSQSWPMPGRQRGSLAAPCVLTATASRQCCLRSRCVMLQPGATGCSLWEAVAGHRVCVWPPSACWLHAAALHLRQQRAARLMNQAVIMPAGISCWWQDMQRGSAERRHRHVHSGDSADAAVRGGRGRGGA